MSWDEFLSFFPEVELPVSVTEELINSAEAVNKVFPPVAIAEYISVWEREAEFDEFTEFVPILRIIQPDDFFAVIYWKGGLMSYEYVLVTLDKEGSLISRRVIASTISDGKTIKRAVAKIDEDLIIHIMAGAHLIDEKYDPAHSKPYSMEIMQTGNIIFSLEEDGWIS